MTTTRRIGLGILAASFSLGLALAPAAQAAEDSMMKSAMHKHMKKHKGTMSHGDAMHGDAMSK